MLIGVYMIELRDVSFKYSDGSPVLEDFNLTIRDGEVVLLCGESGCGKSTVIRLINALIPNYYSGKLDGKITVNGLDTRECELYRISEHVSSVFQNPKTQFYNIDSTEEMVFSLENRGIEREEIKRRLGETVKKLEMEKLLNRDLFAMSGGEKQKVACACADTANTPVIVLDEPSSNLDMESVGELAKIISQWKKDGKTVVIAEHRLYYTLPFADRVIYMKNGRIELECSPREFTEFGKETIRQMGLRSTEYCECEFENSFAEGFGYITDDQDHLLGIKGFSYSYKGSKKPALFIDDLVIPDNSVICVVGDNGAGKSTFARTICGLDKQAKGVLEYKGRRLKRRDRLNNTFMVMQDVAHQLFTDDVAEEIRSCSEGEGKDAEEHILKLLKTLNLSDKKERHPQSLSGGEKQRVAIGSAMIASRDIIVFDEPTSGLDYRNMVIVAGLIRELKNMGKTIFIITHDPELINLCCDLYIRISKGNVENVGITKMYCRKRQ